MGGWKDAGCWWLLVPYRAGLTGAGTAIARYTSVRLKAQQCSNKQRFVEVSGEVIYAAGTRQRYPDSPMHTTHTKPKRRASMPRWAIAHHWFGHLIYCWGVPEDGHLDVSRSDYCK